ncbi:MAG TPA: NAD-dependent epimerase/dehydratase family protein [Candidatus Paceibacterota bacterium]|jgi:nucleoside-diphosphate-sugar epimerase|nr:NAD-dependent epimerase/dehydratase family protein [Candidatus Paceibacterota bacterium]
MKKALITGAAGSVGYYLAQELLKEGYELVLTDNLQRGKKDERFLKLLDDPRLRFIELDLTDPASYPELGGGYDQVYHLAAVNGTKLFYQMPHEVLRINTLSLIYMLEWFKDHSAEGKFCFTSSNEAYAGALESFGQLPLPTPEEVPLVISDPYNPRWSYGSTKLIGELFVIHYAQQYQFKAVIVRPHNFYGPRSGYDHVIPELCQRALAKADPFDLYGPEQTRAFCHLKDAARAMRLLMESSKTDGQPVETVHIGSPEEVTMETLAEKVFSAGGWRPQAIRRKEPPKGSVARRVADIRKIRELVGWEPEISLDEGLKETFAWYAANPKT